MNSLDEIIKNFILSLGNFGPLLSCLLIILESILPALPLFVFISLNYMAWGVWGLIISYVCTILGCLLSFYLCRYKLRSHFERKFRKNEKFNKIMTKCDNIKFKTLSLLVSVPFTPAFLINIAAGLSKISFKKYFYSILFGKVFIVIFWGLVGSSLIESITNPEKLISTLLILALAYIVSSFISKRCDID